MFDNGEEIRIGTERIMSLSRQLKNSSTGLMTLNPIAKTVSKLKW